jgi:hypothetical protein
MAPHGPKAIGADPEWMLEEEKVALTLSGGPSPFGGLVYALPHLLPSSENREALLPNLDQCSGSGVRSERARS